MGVHVAEPEEGFTLVDPVSPVLGFLASYGWYLVAAGAVCIYLVQRLKPAFKSWQEAREDAAYHKDPDKALARMEAIQRARDQQQRALEAASLRALEQERQREERKRRDNLERLERYGESAGAGSRLGAPHDGFLPLSGGADSSSYRPPKRSACSRGGCGR